MTYTGKLNWPAVQTIAMPLGTFIDTQPKYPDLRLGQRFVLACGLKSHLDKSDPVLELWNADGHRAATLILHWLIEHQYGDTCPIRFKEYA